MSATQRVLVTGAASGIGAATLAAFQAAGATVAGLDLRQPKDAACGTWVLADVTDEKAVIAAVSAAALALGGLDVVVNCAGIQVDSDLAEQDLDVFDRMMAVNVRGLVAVTKAALPHLKPGARIINLASELAYLGRAGSSAYCATKGAILSLTRSWARELAPHILVNAVAPGPIDTPLLNFHALKPEVQKLEVGNPLGRIGQPAEVAAAILFLASPGASFITGHCLGVDGGAAMI
ncbi:SDR family NAD(P)-dependent oxidoreductase [Zavarzinia sp. CC-PAN008]|uniref:SDR family NAD(P)-dependent oxidoreductase n=1 Tax=Zavarzinia sp. CC-PAN008 TaxID=3243332 RepID=UPI003F7449CE